MFSRSRVGSQPRMTRQGLELQQQSHVLSSTTHIPPPPPTIACVRAIHQRYSPVHLVLETRPSKSQSRRPKNARANPSSRSSSATPKPLSLPWTDDQSPLELCRKPSTLATLPKTPFLHTSCSPRAAQSSSSLEGRRSEICGQGLETDTRWRAGREE